MSCASCTKPQQQLLTPLAICDKKHLSLDSAALWRCFYSSRHHIQYIRNETFVLFMGLHRCTSCNWDKVTVIVRESDSTTRQIREAVMIKRTVKVSRMQTRVPTSWVPSMKELTVLRGDGMQRERKSVWKRLQLLLKYHASNCWSCFSHKYVIPSHLTSGVCLAISRISVAVFFFTYSSTSFSEVSTAGNMSASTTISARSTLCFAIWLRAENTCLCTDNIHHSKSVIY